jgi:hypothetical protein
MNYECNFDTSTHISYSLWIVTIKDGVAGCGTTKSGISARSLIASEETDHIN